MNRQALRLVLTAVDTSEMLITADDVERWPDDALDSLLRHGLLRPASPASSADCSDCERECAAVPILLEAQPGGTQRAYLMCPQFGRFERPLSDLFRWRVNTVCLLTALAADLGGNLEELLADRLWSLGTLVASSSKTEVLFARGLAWQDRDRVLGELERRRHYRPSVVLAPEPMHWSDSPHIVPLEDALNWDAAGLRVDTSALRAIASQPGVAPPAAPRQDHNCRFTEGVDTWDIVFEGTPLHPPLRSTKGLAYIALLLARPGEDFSALLMVHEVDGTPYTPDVIRSAASAAQLAEEGLSVQSTIGGDQIMDARYEAHCKDLLKQSLEELKRAKEADDPSRIAEAQGNVDMNRHLLSGGVGLGGRNRRFRGESDKARVAVTKAIKLALSKIREQHPPLYEHLGSSLRTGMMCSYTPSQQVPWQISRNPQKRKRL